MLLQRRKRYRNKGFNMLELLATIGIFSIVGLALIGTVAYGTQAQKTYAARMKALETSRRLIALIARGGMIQGQTVIGKENEIANANGDPAIASWVQNNTPTNETDDNFVTDAVALNSPPFTGIVSNDTNNGIDMQENSAWADAQRYIEVGRQDVFLSNIAGTTGSVAVVRIVILSKDLNSPFEYFGTVEI